MWINIQENNDVDLDQTFKISCIQQIVYDKEDLVFYFVANRKSGELGFFLVKF